MTSHPHPRIPDDDPALRARQAELLRRLGPLAGPAEAELGAVLRLAKALTGTGTAVINLLDADEQITIPGDGAPPRTCPREVSICARTAQLPGVFVSGDLAADPAWAGHPSVDGRIARVRLFASAPMRLDPDDDAIGTLCVHDTEPGALTAAQLDGLADLALIALGLLERRWHVTRAVQSAAAAELAQEAADLARQAAEDAGRRAARAATFERALLDQLPVGVVASDDSGRPFLMNRLVAEWSGAASLEEFAGARQLRDIYDADGVTPLDYPSSPLARAFRGEDVLSTEVVIGAPGGPRQITLTSGSTVRDDDGTLLGAVVTITDITRQRELENRLRDAALHDALTGLPNRTLLHDRLSLALHAQRRDQVPFAVVFCDVDGLKGINDSCGHAAGDTALKEAAAHLLSAVRPGDTVARVGGDEFVIVSPQVSRQSDAQRLLERLDRSMALGACSAALPLRVSTGITLSRPDDTPESLLRRADEAMYAGRRAR